LTMGHGCKKLELPGQNGRFIKIFGTSNDDFPNSVVQTSDGGFLIAGTTGNYSYGLDSLDFLFVRTDQYGSPRWYQTFGGNGYDDIFDLVLVSEGDYLAVGTYDDDSSGRRKSVVMRLKETSDSLITDWIRYEDTLGLHSSKSALKASDGNYVVAGLVTDGILLTKYSLGGDIVWRIPFLQDDVSSISKLIELSGGGYVLTGQAYNWSMNSNTATVWKFNVNGYKEKTYRSDVQNSEGISVVELADGKIALLGNLIYSADTSQVFIQVLKPDLTDMSPKRYREFGGSGANYSRVPRLILENDGSVTGGWHTNVGGAGSNDFSLSKIPIVTAEGSIGDRVWHRTYGGSNDDYMNNLIHTTDGGYVLVGFSYSFVAGGGNSADIVLVRTDSEGKLDPED
ncbi:MAG: hypothetical protein RLZZ165_1629, partial [Bacteroidota bacterium]